jgi:ribosome recycling factor
MADIDEIMLEVEEHFEKSLNALNHDFRRIRTGRATVSMIDHVQVDAYGTRCPLTQLAGINVPEPTQLLIKPYDRSTVKDIERALINADLGMSPQSDGEVIRLNVPPLSE